MSLAFSSRVGTGPARPGADSGAAERAGTVAALRERIRGMQRTELESQPLPTLPILGDLLPGGALRAGGVYAVPDAPVLAMALAAGPSLAGSWSAVVDLPTFGLEAAERVGINLERLVVVPQPGAHWLEVVAALADVVTVIITGPAPHLSTSDRARLTARLHQRAATLVTLGTWPGSDAELHNSAGNWGGIGAGFGYLGARELRVEATDRAGRLRRASLTLAESGGLIAAERPGIRAVPKPERRLAGVG
ncbi:hypothetical protein M2390_003007 [Mycetocola sp. BIGb0189]|uniref:hypothetical protein n=1 Tax=Mycetocola sp. BIGb0189 TaxID=2940604 RepID=UPI00216A8375|nr:hypothetical protein [Mycetocola sp. BIGb0189]MCS4277792.1 hypothetical protein [Mycetocola sp. BIGb0189]